MACGNSLENAELVEDTDERSQPYYNQQYLPPVNMISNRIMENYKPKAYKWNDVFALLGFVLSIFGLFWFSVILLPLAAIFSSIGFIGDRSKGIAVAGMVISIVCICIRIGVIVYQHTNIPDWITSGLFW